MRNSLLALGPMLIAAVGCSPRPQPDEARRRVSPRAAAPATPLHASRLQGPYADLAAFCRRAGDGVRCQGAVGEIRPGRPARFQPGAPLQAVGFVTLEHPREGMSRCAVTLQTRRGFWVRDLPDCLLSQGHTVGSLERVRRSRLQRRVDGSSWILLQYDLHLAPDAATGAHSTQTVRFALPCAVDATHTARCADAQVIGYALRRLGDDEVTEVASYRFVLDAALKTTLRIRGRIPSVGRRAQPYVRLAWLHRAHAARGHHRLQGQGAWH